MKTLLILSIIAIIFLKKDEVCGAVVKQQPAFAKPQYSNSYLPGAMQVIFHAVEQLKHMQAEEVEITTPAMSNIVPTSPHPPGQHQPIFQVATNKSTENTVLSSTGSIGYVASTDSLTSTESSLTTTIIVYENTEKMTEAKPGVTAALEAETPEENYATPETNHEVQEPVQEFTESNQEVSEKEDESSEESKESKESKELTELKESKESKEPKESKESNESKESKESEDSSENTSSIEEEDEEIRFSMIGEKVAQVPRPSLMSYLRRSIKAPLRGSVEELAILYDALSKDARKQGLSKFSGYTDRVLKTLETSSEGGTGPQLRTLLEKAVINNELVRDETKSQVSLSLNKLSDPASTLSRDLRRLTPLRYSP